MIKDLIALANSLDKKGFRKEADYLDRLVKKAMDFDPETEEEDEDFYTGGYSYDRFENDSYLDEDKLFDKEKSKELEMGMPSFGDGDEGGDSVGANTIFVIVETNHGMEMSEPIFASFEREMAEEKVSELEEEGLMDGPSRTYEIHTVEML